MNREQILRIAARECWYLNRSLWIIATVSLFAFVVLLEQMGGTLKLDSLDSMKIGLGIGSLGVIAYFAEKFPPKLVKLQK